MILKASTWQPLTRSSSVLKLWPQASLPSCLHCVRPTTLLSTFSTALISAEKQRKQMQSEN